jgi:predicted PurR-regulated permease PerM
MPSRVPAVLLIACALALGWILQPFWGAILWAVIIALLFLPLYHRLLVRLGTGGHRRELAAALVLCAVVLIGVLPLVVVAASLAREAASLVQAISTGAWAPEKSLRTVFENLPGPLAALLDHIGLGSFDVVQKKLAAGAAQASQLIATRALGVGLDTFDFISSLFITLYLAFFLLRDGEALLHTAARGLPLDLAHQQALAQKFSTVVRATVKGSLVVSLVQGALGGLAFWVLDVQGALLWAVLMAFLSLVPAVGAALVWAPVAAFLAMQGHWAGAIGLTAWGVLAIGLVDNLLRPILVGKDTRLPDYVVMIATLGGMSVFGINGFVVGPAIAAMFIAAWHIWVPGSAPQD